MKIDFEDILRKNYKRGKMFKGWKVIKARITYQTGHVAMANVSFKKGGKTTSRDILLQTGGLGALIVTDSKGIVLVKQVRFGANTYHWEIPQETRKTFNEPPEKGASRTVREETGIQDFEVIRRLPFKICSAPHRSTARDEVCLIRAHNVDCSKFDQNEINEMRVFSFAEVRDLIATGQISESVTLTSLCWLFANQKLL